MANMISQGPTLSPSDAGTPSGAPIDFAVGSGSRPTPSKIKIDTTAPSDPKTLGRSVPGALK